MLIRFETFFPCRRRRLGVLSFEISAQPMVSPAICTTNGLLVSLPNDIVIQQMSVFGSRRHPCCLVNYGAAFERSTW